MHSVLSLRRGQAGLAAVLFLAALAALPAAAQSLFPRHQVTAQFATSDGKPMADAEVRVFAPGKPSRPVLVGRTDRTGKFEFPADEDGLWSAEARSGSEIARVMVRVGGKEAPELVSPLWVIGGLLVLLMLAIVYRVARIRSRRRGPTNDG